MRGSRMKTATSSWAMKTIAEDRIEMALLIDGIEWIERVFSKE
jgi:hypothetical protein